MEETFLYRQIAESVRSRILRGELKPGDRLPSVREMMAQWNCTIGTVQRAYQELASQGLVTSRAGQGTRVVEKVPVMDDTPLRRAALIHRAEAFLLEVLTAGYTPEDVEDSVRQALNRWRVISQESAAPKEQELVFSGSHDLAVAWLATHFDEIAPGFHLAMHISGSLGGLIALSEGKADLAGCHLWDEETDTYNGPFVRRLLPGRKVALVNLAGRRLGLILPAGNPRDVQGLPDLANSSIRFLNRQPGSGTRVWLDAALRAHSLQAGDILGYSEYKMDHFDVAQAVAEEQAQAGIGLEAAARVYGLSFVPLTQERYDLAIPAEKLDHPAIQQLLTWLKEEPARRLLAQFSGYDSQTTGDLRWIE